MSQVTPAESVHGGLCCCCLAKLSWDGVNLCLVEFWKVGRGECKQVGFQPGLAQVHRTHLAQNKKFTIQLH